MGKERVKGREGDGERREPKGVRGREGEEEEEDGGGRGEREREGGETRPSSGSFTVANMKVDVIFVDQVRHSVAPLLFSSQVVK